MLVPSPRALRILLTGISGEVGAALAEELVGRGHTLAVLVRNRREDEAARLIGAWPVRPGHDEPRAMARLAERLDGVAHCAAGPRFHAAEAALLLRLAEGLPPGAAFVMAGSARHLADAPAHPTPPQAHIARLRQIAPALRLRAAFVGAALAHGGAQGGAIPRLLLRSARRVGFFAEPEGPAQAWGAVEMGDWASLLALAIEATPLGFTAHAAVTETTSLAEVAAALARALHWPPPIPVPLRRAETLWGGAAAGFFEPLRPDTAAANEALGWAPQGPPLWESLARLAQSGR